MKKLIQLRHETGARLVEKVYDPAISVEVGFYLFVQNSKDMVILVYDPAISVEVGFYLFVENSNRTQIINTCIFSF